jgi:hypothetical protein
VLLAPDAQSTVILTLALAASLGAIFAGSRLSRWYVTTLESSLLHRGSRVHDIDPADAATATVLSDVRRRHAAGERSATEPGVRPEPICTPDPLIQQIATLRSTDHRKAIRLLSREQGLAGPLVPHAIPLLAIDALADYALFALRKVAEEHLGQLTDALLDRNRELAVRRRLARVFSVCVSQRAAQALLAALDDERFDVRFQVARSLSAIATRNAAVAIDPARIYDVVLREVAVGLPVWQGRRLLDGFVSASPLDAFVRDRASQSLAHVFTLLSLVLPREPLQIAFRSLHSNDAHLRGTALEYLEGVLPPAVRQPLWPFLIRNRTVQDADQGQRVVELLRSSKSVTLRGAAARFEQAAARGLATPDANQGRHLEDPMFRSVTS